MDWQWLSIEIDRMDCDRLLSDWRWLVPDDLRPLSMTLFGDWFFEDKQGRIVFLDTVGGRLSEIAGSHDSFLVERERPRNLDEWYMADFARLCRENGLIPRAGQCLGFVIPPILSGPIEIENIEVCDLMINQSILGQIHRQAQDLPEGTVIDHLSVDGELP